MSNIQVMDPNDLLMAGGHYPVKPGTDERLPPRVWRIDFPDAEFRFESDFHHKLYLDHFIQHGVTELPTKYAKFLWYLADFPVDHSKPSFTPEQAKAVFAFAWNKMWEESVANEPFPLLEIIKKGEGEPSP